MCFDLFLRRGHSKLLSGMVILWNSKKPSNLFTLKKTTSPILFCLTKWIPSEVLFSKMHLFWKAACNVNPLEHHKIFGEEMLYSRCGLAREDWGMGCRPVDGRTPASLHPHRYGIKLKGRGWVKGMAAKWSDSPSHGLACSLWWAICVSSKYALLFPINHEKNALPLKLECVVKLYCLFPFRAWAFK